MHQELHYPGSLKLGDKGTGVKRLQEWLNLAGQRISIDSEFGPVTYRALCRFQDSRSVLKGRSFDEVVWSALTLPLASATKPLPPGFSSLRAAIVAAAKQHAAQRPREVGGDNRGPWVRYYMNGKEGDSWYWCAGFVSRLVEQACAALSLPVEKLPFSLSFSCDELATSAKKNKRLLDSAVPENMARMAPGDIFLVRKTSTDWVHTGIVTGKELAEFTTIEGNTNDDGSPNGYEVASRSRGYASKNFISLSGIGVS